mmetsp:Transcript_15461/g.46408  ORF Transcript_15461/g.46408 Transcript_15461/m.46408 type:complete len:211 (+) Transcript_15461:1157-1789(+)
MLEVARDERLVLAALLVAVLVLLLATVAAVVEEELVLGAGAVCKPAHRRQHVGLRRHHVCAVVAEAADLRVLEAEGILEDAYDGVRVVDAARQASLPGPQRQVVDANRQGLARWRPRGDRRRRLHRLRRRMRLGHEAVRERDGVVRRELRHLREVVHLEELPHLGNQVHIRSVRVLRDDELEGRCHGACGELVSGQTNSCIGAGLVVHAA